MRIQVFHVLSAVRMATAALLVLLGLYVALQNPGDYYEPPHACVAGECGHPVEYAPDGKRYCTVYPPKDIKYAQVSTREKYTRLAGGTVCGLAVLGGALLVLLRGWPFQARTRRSRPIRDGVLTVGLVFSSLGLAVLGLTLKAVYGFPPR